VGKLQAEEIGVAAVEAGKFTAGNGLNKLLNRALATMPTPKT
jgi:hypothetical protein